MARIPKSLIGHIRLGLTLALLGAGVILLLWWQRPYHPEERLGQSFHYSLWRHGQPVGHQQESLHRFPDGSWQLLQNTRIQLTARAQLVEVDEQTDWRFAADYPYPLLAVQWRRRQGETLETLVFNVDEGHWRGERRSNGELTLINQNAQDYSLMDVMHLSVLARKPEQALPWRQLELDSVNVVSRPVTVLAEGSRWRFQPWQFRVQGESPIDYTVSASGVPVAMQLGERWQMRWQDDEAVQTVEANDSDRLQTVPVRAQRELGQARTIRGLSLRWPLHIALPLSHSESQQVLPGFVYTDNRQPAAQASDAEQRQALQNEPRYRLDDKRLQRLAAQLTENAESGEQKVERLLLFVSQHLQQHDVLVDQSATEILQNRVGDCTEYAQLFVALARAAGLPAREVSGWVYLGDGEPRFGGHAWAEVAIGGRWLSADPMWNLMPVSGSHLRMGDGEAGALAVAQAPHNFEFVVEQVSYQ